MSTPLHRDRPARPHAGAGHPAAWIEVAATVLCGVAVLVVGLDAVALTLSLPRVAADLGDPGAGAGWVVTGYLVGLLAWSGVCAIATSVAVLAGARIVAGMLAALVLAGAVATLAGATRSRARVTGTVTACVVAAVVAGPSLAALVIEKFGWRGVFAVHIPVVVALILLAVATHPGHHTRSRSRGSRGRGMSLRAGAAVLGFVAMTAVVAATSYARVWPGPLSWIVALAGLACLGLLVLRVRSSFEPVLGTDIGAWIALFALVGSVVAVVWGIGVFGYLVSASLLMMRPGEVTWLPALGCAGAVLAAAMAAALVSGARPARNRLAVVSGLAVAATTAGFLVVYRDVVGVAPLWWAWTVAVACTGTGIGCAVKALTLINRTPATTVELGSGEPGAVAGGLLYGVIGTAGLGAALTCADLLADTFALWAHLGVTVAMTGVLGVATTYRATARFTLIEETRQ